MQSVKIVAVSKPTISDPITGYIVGVDEFIAYVARVSNPSNQMNTQTAPKLLKLQLNLSRLRLNRHAMLSLLRNR